MRSYDTQIPSIQYSPIASEIQNSAGAGVQLPNQNRQGYNSCPINCLLVWELHSLPRFIEDA